jgi:hypothetical protein
VLTAIIIIVKESRGARISPKEKIG